MSEGCKSPSIQVISILCLQQIETLGSPDFFGGGNDSADP